MRITPYDDITWTRFTVRTGAETHRWTFGRSAKSDVWYLRDHQGCVRTLESTWVDSLPRIQGVVANYGFASSIS